MHRNPADFAQLKSILARKVSRWVIWPAWFSGAQTFLFLSAIFACGLGGVQAQNLLPPFIEAGNPYIATTFTNPRVGTETSLSVHELQDTALAYCHPQSPFFGDEGYRDRLLLVMDSVTSNRTRYASFELPLLAHAYGCLKAVHPSALSAERQAHYELNLTNGANALIESRGDLWLNQRVDQTWYNADVRWALGVYFTGLAVGDSVIQSVGEAFFDFEYQDQLMLQDGGIHYVGFQNEVFTYRDANISSLAWYYLVSEKPHVLEILRKSNPYYPLATYGGLGEYYTSVSWKHYWNLSKPGRTAFMVGSLTECPYNYDLGRDAGSAFFFNPNITNPVVEQPDNYMVHDRSIRGPRGRFGLFGYAGSAQVTDNYPEPTIGVGKSTIAGAHVLNQTPAGVFPYNAAIEIVGLEIKVAPGAEAVSDERRKKYRFLTTNEKTSNTSSKQVHGLTSTYNPSNKIYAGGGVYSALNWEIHEQWMFMPDRLVGHLSINSLIDNNQAYGIGSIVKMVAGRLGWGEAREVIDLGSGHFSYGRLHFIIKEQNLNGETITEDAPVYGGVTAKSKYHRMLDAKSSGQPEALFNYNQNDKYYFVIEIFEEGTSIATVSSSREADLHMLTVSDGVKTMQSVMNITGQDQIHTVNWTGGFNQGAILKSWDDDQALGTALVAGSISIPAHSSVLLLESSDPAAVSIREDVYEDIFNPRKDCPPGTPCNDGNPCTTADSYGLNCQCEGTFLDQNNNGQCDFEDCEPVLASHDDGNIAANTLDGNLDTYWAGDAGERIEYCLEEQMVLQGIEIAFHRGAEGTTVFDLEVSIDGESWIRVFCDEESLPVDRFQRFDFGPMAVKKFAFVGQGSSRDGKNALAEVRWFPVTYQEAEHAEIQGQWEVQKETRASANEYIVMNASSIGGPHQGDELVYEFEVQQAGDYSFWGRTLAPNANDDSFYMRINEGEWILWTVPRSSDWRWNRILNRTLTFPAGTHRLSVHYRESGTWLDQLCLVDADYGPPPEREVISPGRPGIYMEAEYAPRAGVWEIEEDPMASSGGYMVNNALSNASPDDSRALLYDFTVTSVDDYKLWARTIAPNAGDDSFWIKMDDGEWRVWNGVPRSTDWRWNQALGGISYALAPGAHRLFLHYRENGAKVDKLYIAGSGACDPVGVGGSPANCTPGCAAGTIDSDGDAWPDVVEQFFGTPPVEAEAWPRLQIAPLQTTGQASLAVPAYPGVTIEVQESTDMQNWFKLHETTAPAMGVFEFPLERSGRRLFYRSVYRRN